MRELCHSVTDIDRQLEDAARAKQQLDAERWREQVRPRAMRLFAAHTAKLHGSRALLKLLVDPRDATPAITTAILRLASTLSRLSASLQPHVGLRALTGSRSSPGRALT